MKMLRGLLAFLVVGCLATSGPLQASSGPTVVDEGVASVEVIVTPPEHRRGEDQTPVFWLSIRLRNFPSSATSGSSGVPMQP